MNFKKFSIFTLAIGLFSILSGLLLPIVTIYTISKESEMPFRYSFSIDNDFLCDLPYGLLLLGILLALWGLFCLILHKKIQNICGWKTSLTALGISASGALFLGCLSIWFDISPFWKTPLPHPLTDYSAIRIDLDALSIPIGVVALIAFIALIIVYAVLRKRTASIKGFLLDTLQSILSMIPLYYIFASIYQILA